MTTATTSCGPSSPSEVGGDWADLLRLLPGYDPFAAPAGAWFDAAAADLAVQFFPTCLRHVEGELAGEPFALQPWQRAWVGNLFGWKQRDGRGRVVRRYRETLLYVPRKCGKTPLAAGVALYVFFCDKEAGQQDYVAAADREQAGMLFRQAKGMVEAEPDLKRRCRIYGGTASAGQSKSIVKPDGSFLRVVSADAHTRHGGTSHLILIDELHAQPNRDLVDVLTTSTASLNRAQPLTVFITTADYNRESICNEKYAHAKRVCDSPETDPRFLPAVYEADPAEDWTSPDTWAKANPNLGVSVSFDYLERECAKAKDVPQYENTFKRLHLNLRTDADVRWLSSVLWDANGRPFAAEGGLPLPESELLADYQCFGGLDLANTNDLAALALVWKPTAEGKPWYVKPWFWTHEEACRERERSNRARFDAWAAKGLMAKTPGSAIDYGYIRATANALNARFRFAKLAFDPYNADHFAQVLQDQDGLPVLKFVQSLTNYAAPCKRLVELLKEGNFRHGGNPVLRWMAGNVSVYTDGRGYLMPHRGKSTDKIDGIAASLMALGVALGAEGPSVYETRGLVLAGAGGEPVPAPAAVVESPAPAWGGQWPDDDED